ncbi:MAG TPA: hypothetical protein VNN62_21455 [Methylomirabilota bacterium]|jgi:hypothetical protein|nr:hypothetical protein [Methylomirabilota bacterium]
MRLRLAPVEYKTCTTAGCEMKYEGAQCPKCRQAFTPQQVVKALHDRLILVDVDPPLYEQTQRCRCTECKNLFDLSEHDVIARAQCAACGKPLFQRAQLQKIWQEAETLLQRARKLDRALRQVAACPHCAQSVTVKSWCPLHDPSTPPGPTGGLPQNLTVVWVRTFHTAESLEELQQREWLEDEPGLEPETEIETEAESERDDA